MDLKTYLKSRRQVDLARALGVTQGAVNQWASGLTRVAVERCIAIERATERAVTCEDLRPDVDWAYLRGTAAVVARPVAPTSISEEKKPVAPAIAAQDATNTEAKSTGADQSAGPDVQPAGREGV